MQQYDLSTRYDARASFYGKAHVNVEGSVYQLVSYSTTVAEITTMPNGTKTASVFGTYSQTTLRHIKEFLLQDGFKAENSKQIMADYGTKE